MSELIEDITTILYIPKVMIDKRMYLSRLLLVLSLSAGCIDLPQLTQTMAASLTSAPQELQCFIIQNHLENDVYNAEKCKLCIILTYFV